MDFIDRIYYKDNYDSFVIHNDKKFKKIISNSLRSISKAILVLFKDYMTSLYSFSHLALSPHSVPSPTPFISVHVCPGPSEANSKYLII